MTKSTEKILKHTKDGAIKFEVVTSESVIRELGIPPVQDEPIF